MTEVINDQNLKNPVERKTVSLELGRFKEKIMRMWEARVRENVSSAPTKSTSELRNQLAELLDNLVSNISVYSDGMDMHEAGEIGKAHGSQRAGLTDYTFSQVLHEYRILRQVIFEVLEEEKIQRADVRNTILNVLDKGIEKAIEQFSLLRSEELKRSNRDLEHFAAIAAHDLKSPLATIIGFVELLDDSLQGRMEIEEMEYIKAIKRSSSRMTLLIDRLLEYSSVGRENRAFELVSIRHVVEGAVESLRTVIEKLNARIHFDKLPEVMGDVSLLSQLFQNFISNSLKFRDLNREPDIRITAEEQKESWLFSIQDNGIGFDPKDKENIFSLFKRLDGAKAPSGLGIGLATVRKVIEHHGGQVWAESQPGLGSTFFFTLPK